MNNLVMKDLRLGVHPMFYLLPVLTGALMLIPGWIYFMVILYFFCITVPNMFGGWKSQNDLMFTAMMPVTKQDIVKARLTVIVILELLHIGIAMLFGQLTLHLYPDMIYYFFAPYMGFWGLCFVMLAIFNLAFIPIYYKTAYKYGSATTAGILFATIFAGIAQWIGIQNSFVYDTFNGSGSANTALQLSILAVGIAIFIACTVIAYRMAVRRLLQVEIL